MAMDVVDYEIKGAEMQFVEVELDPGEAAVGEAGSMMFMENGIVLDTIFGDGFVMQRLEGDGMAFIHAGGTVEKRDLQPGETLLIDHGCLVAFTQTVNFEIQYVGGVKTALFGGEGLFFAKVTGPGTVWIQSLPFSRLASRIFAAAPQNGGSSDRAGSTSGGGVLGGLAAGGILGGLGSLLGGDND